MKNPKVDPYAAEDIRGQVAKVLRGLGNPEPPLKLEDVRALLELDRKFYSTKDTGPLREFFSKLKVGAKQVIMRPTLILDAVREAGLRAVWLPDRKRILMDSTIPDLKKRHVEAHEITHSITEHHAPYFIGDNRETLRPSCHDKLEAEANFGSGELLFFQSRFTQEALDLPRTIDTIKKLAKRFGNTNTMTLWRLIETAPDDELLFGVVSGHPKRPDDKFDPSNPCRYFIQSPGFRERFGNVTEVSVFTSIKGYCNWKRGGPLGEGDADFVGLDGTRHRFHLETFHFHYESLTLGVHVGPVRKQVAVP
jgi:hypothetical protein